MVRKNQNTKEIIDAVYNLFKEGNPDITSEQADGYVEALSFLRYGDYDPIAYALRLIFNDAITPPNKLSFLVIMFVSQAVRKGEYSDKLYNTMRNFIVSRPFLAREVADQIVEIFKTANEMAYDVYNSINNKKQAV